MSDVPSDTPPATWPPSGDPAAPAPTPAALAPRAIASAYTAPPAAPGAPRLVTVNTVNWANVLDFTQLFRGFRLAINPAKLAMALLAILVIYGAGRIFDFAWGPQVYDGEMSSYAALPPQEFRAQRIQVERNRDDFFHGTSYDEIKAKYKKQFDDELQAAHDARLAAEKNASTHPAPGQSLDELEQAARKAAADAILHNMDSLNSARGRGIFATFLTFEISQFDHLANNTLALVHLNVAAPTAEGAGPAQAFAMPGAVGEQNQLWRSDTILGNIANMVIIAPKWLCTATAPMQWRPDNADTTMGWIHMLSYRGLYLASLLALGVLSLLMLGVTGATITRLSALELAGIERAPLKDVFFFAARRLWTFIKTPVTPFLIILAIGIVMAVVAMLGAIPYAGPVLIGLILVAFLGLSFVLMLLLLGILGGFNLLYPAIAVEGADSFDAMSRSFAYAYARPWRLGFYTLTSLVYGVLTFLFVSFAVFLILLLTHTFVGWGMNLMGIHYGSQSGVPALETLWPAPHFLQLVPSVNWYVMTWPEWIGSILVHFWVFLVVAGIGAYVISYYFSSHTIIYLLLRRSVDGQNLKEVYMEDKSK